LKEVVVNQKQVEKAAPPWRVYAANRPQELWDEADQYRDEWLAWSADGTRIIAHHHDPSEVCALVKAAGLESEDVVLSYIPPGGMGETWL
jgi:hypothetical protein